MKLILLTALAGVALGARLDTSYLPPRVGGGGGRPFRGGGGASFGGSGAGSFGGGSGAGSFGSGSGSVGGGAFGGSFRSGPQVPILRYDNNNDGTGNYNYNYETGNGIQAEERGHLKGGGSQNEAKTAEGSFSYTAPDGQRFSIQYVADENGFRPVGAHLPTPPPIPEAILRSLEQNRLEGGGNYGSGSGGGDDGQYRPGFGGGGNGGGFGTPTQSYNPQTGYNY